MIKRPFRFSQFIVVLLAFNVFLGVLYGLITFTGSVNPSIVVLFDLNEEGNFPTWYASFHWV